MEIIERMEDYGAFQRKYPGAAVPDYQRLLDVQHVIYDEV